MLIMHDVRCHAVKGRDSLLKNESFKMPLFTTVLRFSLKSEYFLVLHVLVSIIVY